MDGRPTHASRCSARGIALHLALGLAVVLMLAGPIAAEHQHHHDHHDDHDDDDSSEGILYLLAAGLAAHVAASPWWAPPSLLADDYTVGGRFARYPYQGDQGGFLLLDAVGNDREPGEMDSFGRVNIDYGVDFDGLRRVGTRFHFETRNRWGLNSSWSHYTPYGPDHGLANYSAGDANAIFRFAQSEHAHWWTGVGFNWLHESGDTEFGYNLTYGADVFLGDPWILSAKLDWGEIAHDGFFRGQTTIGVQRHRVEVFGGFDYLDFREHHDAVVLVGLRVWF